MYSTLLLQLNPTINLHSRDHRLDFCFAFLFRGCVHVFMNAFPVCAAGGVFAFPEVVVDLVQAAGAGFSAGTLEGLEELSGGYFSSWDGRYDKSASRASQPRSRRRSSVPPVSTFDPSRGCRRSAWWRNSRGR